MWSNIVKKIKSANNIYILFAFVITVLFTKIHIINDDKTLGAYKINNLWEFIYDKGIVESYYGWSSRVIINMLMYTMLAAGRYIWAITMGMTFFIMLYSISVWVNADKWEQKLAVVAIILLYPYKMLTTAGWICTSVTYVIPITLALYGSLAIHDVYTKKNRSIAVNIVYVLFTIIAANAEQVMAVLFLLYTLILGYFIFKEHISISKLKTVMVQYGVIILTIVYTVLCPGNKVRKSTEIIAYFPDFDQLTLVNKFDIGFFNTIDYMMTEKLIFMIILAFGSAALIWSITENKGKRIISLCPVILTLYYIEPINEFVNILFPPLSFIPNDIPYYGILSQGVSENGMAISAIQIAAYVFFLVDICLIFWWLTKSCYEKIITFSLILGGLGSRIVIGFVPSVYVSATRTYAVMVVCLMTAFLFVLMNNYNLLSKKVKNIVYYMSVLIIPIAAVALMVLIFVTDK